MEGAPLLGALLAGARLGMLDPLTRAEHLWQPFWEELETAETLSGLDQLTATLMRLWCLGQSLPAAAAARRPRRGDRRRARCGAAARSGPGTI